MLAALLGMRPQILIVGIHFIVMCFSICGFALCFWGEAVKPITIAMTPVHTRFDDFLLEAKDHRS